MGDLCDVDDLEHFRSSPEGQAHMEEIRLMLLGRTIRAVTFSNEGHNFATLLYLDDDTTFVVFQPSLEVDAIRQQFAGVLKREYYEDHPERMPR